MPKTPLYVEDLLEILNDRKTWATASYMGATDRVVDRTGLVELLEQLVAPYGPAKTPDAEKLP